jgi:hypothetical protein
VNKSSEIQGAEGGRGVLEPVLSEAKKFLGQDPLFTFLFGGAKRKRKKTCLKFTKLTFGRQNLEID